MNRRRMLAIIGTAAAAIGFVRSSLGEDMQLEVNESALQKLRALRAEAKFTDLPGLPAAEERRRMEPLMNALLERIIQGISSNPRKSWLIKEMEPTVQEFYLEDTEVRERCVDYLERILGVFGIKSTNGAFEKYFLGL
jgi:hypothetical protein